jgi:hypothetical protein
LVSKKHDGLGFGILIFSVKSNHFRLLFPRKNGNWGGGCLCLSDEYRWALSEDLNKNNYAQMFEFFNFEDDPVKYSKLLWNCNEEKGGKEIFKLLNIK